FSLRLDRRIAEHYALSLRSRLGQSEGESQVGFAVGVSWLSSGPTEPEHHEVHPMGSAWGRAPREPPRPSPAAPTGPPPVPPPSPAPQPVPPPILPPSGERPPDYGTYDPVDSEPTVTSRVDPVFPDSARAQGISGTVTVAALIDAEGNVQETRVVRSVPLLDQ